MTVTEVVLSTCAGEDQVLMWDLRTLAVLGSYKGNPNCARHGLATVAQRMLIGAQRDKPALRAWCWEKDQPLHKFSGPEKIHVLACSPDGYFCVGGGASGKVFVWQVATGRLLHVIDAHFKGVSCVRFSDDGSRVLTAGHDGAVHVWAVGSLASIQSHTTPAPLLSLSGHSLAVTDMHVGIGGPMARVATVSLDRTCKIWDISTGQLLTTITFPTYLNCVVLDPAEFNIIVGGGDGNIFHVPLYSSALVLPGGSGLRREAHAGPEHAIQGHGQQPVTALALSFDATLLISGSADGTVTVWDIACKQMLRTFKQHSGGDITNLIATTKPPTTLTMPYSAADLPAFSPFSRYLPENNALSYTAKIQSRGDDSVDYHSGAIAAGRRGENEQIQASMAAFHDQGVQRAHEVERQQLEASNATLREENERIRRLNTELYRRAAQAVINSN